jgi:hypothetical protein
MSTRSALRFATVGLLALSTTACALGDRPTLAEPAPAADTAAERVLDLLRRAPDQTFIASYLVTPSSAEAPVDATVTRTAAGVLTVEIGDTVYTTSADGRTTTCDVGGNDCDDFANDARISNLGITHLFWGPAFERRLQTDSSRRIGPSAQQAATIAGASAECVEVRVQSSLDAVGIVSYCALGDGLLARYQGADVIIEMLSFSSPSG